MPAVAGICSSVLTLLIRQATLTVWALRVALCAVHLAVAAVLLRAVDLLRLSVLSGGLATGSLVPYWRELRTAHLRMHHVWLAVLGRLTLGLRRILTLALRLLTLPFLLCLASVLLFLLLRLPFLADFFELCNTQSLASCRADPRVW